MSTPTSLELPEGTRRATVETARGAFAVLDAMPAAGPCELGTALLVPGYTGQQGRLHRDPRPARRRGPPGRRDRPARPVPDAGPGRPGRLRPGANSGPTSRRWPRRRRPRTCSGTPSAASSSARPYSRPARPRCAPASLTLLSSARPRCPARAPRNCTLHAELPRRHAPGGPQGQGREIWHGVAQAAGGRRPASPADRRVPRGAHARQQPDRPGDHGQPPAQGGGQDRRARRPRRPRLRAVRRGRQRLAAEQQPDMAAGAARASAPASPAPRTSPQRGGPGHHGARAHQVLERGRGPGGPRGDAEVAGPPIGGSPGRRPGERCGRRGRCPSRPPEDRR